MSISLNYPATDSTSLVTPGLTIPALQWAKDWAILSRASDSAVIKHMATALDTPETVRFQGRSVADVYANSGIDRSLWATNRTGREIRASLNSAPYAVDSENPAYRVVYPVRCALQICVPQSELFTDEVLAYYLGRTVAAYFETDGTTPNARLAAFVRGILLPRDM